MTRRRCSDGEIRGVVRAAHEHDKYVVAHSGDSVAIRQALTQGVTSFEHAYRLDERDRPDAGGPEHLPDADAVRHPQRILDAGEPFRGTFDPAGAGRGRRSPAEHPAGHPSRGQPGQRNRLPTRRSGRRCAGGRARAAADGPGRVERPCKRCSPISTQAARLLRIDDHVGQIRPGYVGDLIAVDGDPLRRSRRAAEHLAGGPGRRRHPWCRMMAARAVSGRKPVGGVAGYSRAVRAGDFVAISGTTAPDGGRLLPGDTHGQTTVALRRVIAAVEALGGSDSDIIRTRIMLVPGADVDAACRAHQELLGDVRPGQLAVLRGGPDRSTGLLVEVEADAVVELRRRVVTWSLRLNNDLPAERAIGDRAAGRGARVRSALGLQRPVPALRAGVDQRLGRPDQPDQTRDRHHEPVLGARGGVGNGCGHAGRGVPRPVSARGRRRIRGVSGLGRLGTAANRWPPPRMP